MAINGDRSRDSLEERSWTCPLDCYRFGKEAVAALLGTRRVVLPNSVLDFTHCRIYVFVTLIYDFIIQMLKLDKR
jgi:hypothetical protein